MLILALFIIAKKQEKSLPINEWINQTWDVHIMGNYLAIKRNKILIHATTCNNEP